MALLNIDERRKAIEEALSAQGVLSPASRKKLAEQFSCSPAVIWSDMLLILNGNINHVNKPLREKIIARDGNTCYICGKPTSNPIIEHKVPARAGGKASDENLAVACMSCNMKKKFTDKILYPLYPPVEGE